MTNKRAIASGLGLILLIILFGLASRWERGTFNNSNTASNETSLETSSE